MICPLCASEAETFERAPGYGIDVCLACWDGAENGWPRAQEETLFRALANAGLLIPDRNDAGLLPRGYAPPADYQL
jgi:hypothetical protein